MVAKFDVFSSTLEVLIQDTNFTNNSKLPDQDKLLRKNLNVVAVFTIKTFKIINCIFAMNQQTALQAFKSILYFGGVATITSVGQGVKEIDPSATGGNDLRFSSRTCCSGVHTVVRTRSSIEALSSFIVLL